MVELVACNDVRQRPLSISIGLVESRVFLACFKKIGTHSTTMSRSSNRADSKVSRPVRGRNALLPQELSVSRMYEVQGDSHLAHDAYRRLCQAQPTPTQLYNRDLLSYVTSAGTDHSVTRDIDKWRKEWDDDAKDEGLPPRKRKRKQMTVLYNQCLFYYVDGKLEEASAPLLKILKPMVVGKVDVHEELLNVIVRMAFLILECILAKSVGSHSGLQELDDMATSESISNWIESQDLDGTSQLKFLHTLYKSRLDFAARDVNDGRLVDSKVRGVKKELKFAMELFNHKLRTTGETGSIGSSDSGYVQQRNRANSPGPSQQDPQENLLQAHNQSALNLKAHLEQLKGNTKKSLVLCSESRAAHNDGSYMAIDANNLSIVYATSHKKHLALYTTAKALRATKGGHFRSDGTACPDLTNAILHNASLSALQGRNYASAYECMASCVQRSATFSDRPRCWLRMAEACIGA